MTVFSYDATTGQFPTSQGWIGVETDTTGPLTGASLAGAVSGTAAANANSAIELVGGINTLHMRDTLTDTTADLPEFAYPWTTTQQQLLIDNGLKFTLVAQALTNTASNSNLRFGFNNTEFEFQNDNILADQTIQVTNFGSAAFPVDGQFHTLVISGQKSGPNFNFSYTIDGGASTALALVTNPAPPAFESTVYFGALSSGGRNSDLLIRSATMETLGVVAPQIATINRVNNSAYGSLTIQNNSSPITIIGYSVLSEEGALRPAGWTSIADAYDLSGNHSVDPDDEWLKLSPSTSRDNLSEFEPDGNGATIATGQSFALGNIWIQNPTEDISVELLLSDGSILTTTVKYTGNSNNRFNFGDLDFDGDFDVADFTAKFVPSFGASTSALSSAEKYQAGDFNGDNVVDELDFLVYNAAYRTAHPGAGSLVFGAIPEPGTLTLFFGGAVILVARRRRTISFRRSSLMPLVAGLIVVIQAANSNAATPVAYWNFNESTGATSLVDSVGTNNSTSIGTSVAGAAGKIGSAWTFSSGVNGITIDSSGPALTGLGLNYSFSGWVKSTANLGTLLSISDNTVDSEEVVLRVSDNGDLDGRAGVLGRPNIDGPGNEALSTTFVNNNAWHHVAYASTASAWKIYVDGVLENTGAISSSPAAIGANSVHVGVNQDSTGLQWGLVGAIDDLAIWNGTLTDAEVTNVYVKGLYGHGALEAFTDALSLQVNRTNGGTTLKNTGATGFDVDLYRISSAASSLQASSWSSLDDQNFDSAVWTELANANNKVSEGALGESTLLANGLSQTLGNLYKTSIDAQDLVLEYHIVGTPSNLLIRGNVSYITGGGGVGGDYNGNGVVDAADYAVWRDHLGQSFALPNETQTIGQVTVEDYNYWRSRFGATSGSGTAVNSSVASVPEPASLWLFALGAFALIRKRAGRAACVFASLAVFAAPVSPVNANARVDRSYLLGDDSAENGVAGNVVGSGTGSATYDSAGSPGAGDLQDLLVNGDPLYVNAGARPGATGTNRGASFDGVDDSLSTPINFNSPTNTWNNTSYFPTTPFPHNYATIVAHGIQLWARPTASALGQNRQQGLIYDSLEQGIYITTNDTWGLWFDDADGPGVDSGVHVDTIANGGWTHVMELAGYDDQTGGKARSLGALLVNGVAVAAINSPYDTDASPLVVGAQSDGVGGKLNHYAGTLDDVRIFMWGDNTGQSNAGRLGQNWGKLDLAVDNEWIAQKLASLGITNRADVNLNGLVSGNGTGPASTDDVTAFIQNWHARRLVDGIQVGDWISRQQGDLNYDGIVDLKDAFVLHQGLIGAGSGTGLDFSLLGGTVPEPSTALLAILTALFSCLTTRTRTLLHGEKR